jgi:hypothetical protein
VRFHGRPRAASSSNSHRLAVVPAGRRERARKSSTSSSSRVSSSAVSSAPPIRSAGGGAGLAGSADVAAIFRRWGWRPRGLRPSVEPDVLMRKAGCALLGLSMIPRT